MFSNKEEEDEMAAARDIAEFERNKHLSRPCTTLDGFNVSKIFYAWKWKLFYVRIGMQVSGQSLMSACCGGRHQDLGEEETFVLLVRAWSDMSLAWSLMTRPPDLYRARHERRAWAAWQTSLNTPAINCRQNWSTLSDTNRWWLTNSFLSQTLKYFPTSALWQLSSPVRA